MTTRDVSIPATDGFPIAATLFEPSSPIIANLLIAGATGVRRRLYSRYARFLCGKDFRVLTFDYRGMGDSKPAAGERPTITLHDWGEKDLAGVIDWMRKTNDAKLFVLGHSVGGQLMGLTRNNNQVDGLLAVAVQSGYWRLWPFPRRYLMAGLWYVAMPALTRLLGYFPGKRLKVSDDLPAGVALEWARWCRNPAYVVNAQGQPDREYFQKFRSPIRYYRFTDDSYAPDGTVESLMSCFSRAPRSGITVNPSDYGLPRLGHFGFFREKGVTKLWEETANWLRSA